MSPPPSPSSRPSSPILNKDAIPPARFYDPPPGIPARRAKPGPGSSHTTFTTVPVPDSSSSSPPPYSADLDPDYKPPLPLPSSPPETPQLITDSDPYPWGSTSYNPNGDSGLGLHGTGSWSPSSIDTPVHGAWGDSWPAEPPAPQYGSGMLQDLLAWELRIGEGGGSGGMDAGMDVSPIWEVEVRGVPEAEPARPPSAAPPIPPRPSSTDSTASAQRTSPAAAPPPTLRELQNVVPHHLTFLIPFAPLGWLPISISTSPYPSLADPTAVLPLPTHPPFTPPCHEGRTPAHHFHAYRGAVLPSAVEGGERVAALPPLDLHFCCQCPLHVVAPAPGSGDPRLPTVIDAEDMHTFVQERASSPPPGSTAPAAVLLAIETLLRMNEGLMFRGLTQCVKVNNAVFQRKVGWSDAVQRIIKQLGWVVSTESAVNAALAAGTHSPPPPMAGGTALDHQVLVPPRIPLGSEARETLLRAWIELGAFAAVWKRRYPDMPPSDHKLFVEVKDAKKALEDKLGVRQLFASDWPRDSPIPLPECFQALGLGPRYTATLIERAYTMQVRCDAARASKYFSCLHWLADHHLTLADKEPVEMLIAQERSKGRVSASEAADAYGLLGFGEGGELMLEGADVEDAAVWSAWGNKVDRRAAERRDLMESLRVIAEYRESAWLKAKMAGGEADRRFGMDLDEAYRALEVPREGEIEDEVLIAIYQLRVGDQPGQQDRMFDALRAIAQQRNSWRLKRFLETGNPNVDEPPAPVVPLEFPRGLDQLGNTCYLNSLLQYFYTIKDLRETIIDSAKIEDDMELISSGELERKRVGGRLITKKEIQRSTQFVRLLSFLFMQLSLAETHSVTPEIELAKLALVTSEDEEEDTTKQQPQDPIVTSPTEEKGPSSDATLVDEPMPLASSPPSASRPPFTTAPSVLGKRDRNSQLKSSRSVMDIDAIAPQPERAVTAPFLPDRSNLEEGELMKRASTVPMDVDFGGGKDVDMASASQDVDMAGASQQDVEMGGASQDTEVGGASQSTEMAIDMGPSDENKENAPPLADTKPQPPPLPPRSTTKKPEVQSESFMMFGRQHDVSECMDNCMFQIEAALKPDPGLDPGGSETSLVKRLFYGKIRQRLTGSSSSGSIHEKDDLFAHLHVNVGDEGFDLYDGLGDYFEDVVEFDGRLAKMDVTLVDLPPLLQIQLQRVQFNRETMQPYKSNAYVKFGETLSVDRFLELADPQKRERTKAIRRQLAECRDRIKDLTQNKAGSFVETLAETRAVLDEQKELELSEWTPDFSEFLKEEREELVREIETLRMRASDLKAELESIWADDHEAEYELSSVFMHRGNHAFGHYWFYSRWLPEQPDSWFKYNDSSVTLVPKSEVLEDATGSTANPYLLVFARKGLGTIETVKRMLA